jgi:hypothetical protein
VNDADDYVLTNLRNLVLQGRPQVAADLLKDIGAQDPEVGSHLTEELAAWAIRSLIGDPQ